MSTGNLLIESQYFPSVHAMKAMVDSEQLLIEQWEHYCKMSFRNRCIITGSNGPIHLSIPLKDGRQQRRLITDVMIDNTLNWQVQHWRSISSCYARAPYFDYFEMKFQPFFQETFDSLFQFNQSILTTLLSVFKSKTTLQYTQSYQKDYDSYPDFRNHFLPKNYTQHTEKAINYTQVFEDKNGFLPNLSIIDYICCEGVKL